MSRGMNMRDMKRNQMDPGRRERLAARHRNPDEGPQFASEDFFDEGAVYVDQGDGCHVACGRYDADDGPGSPPDRAPPGWGEP